MNVGQYLETISESVLAQTKMIRASFTNSSNKGHGFEIIIRDLLDEYIANSNFVNHGEIIDSFGSKTGQIDFAILENLHPSGSTDGRPRILLFDAVHAVGECKLLLNTGELDLIINANQNFRKLKISKDNNNRTTNEFTNKSDELSPPYFVVGNDCNVRYERLESELDKGNISFMIALNHTTTNTGLIYLGAEYRKDSTIRFCEEIGTKKVGNYLYETKNPVVPLIWAVNKFQIPMISLTNTFHSYLQIE